MGRFCRNFGKDFGDTAIVTTDPLPEMGWFVNVVSLNLGKF